MRTVIIIVKRTSTQHKSFTRPYFRTYAAAPTSSHNAAGLSPMGGGRYQALQPAEPIRNAQLAANVCA